MKFLFVAMTSMMLLGGPALACKGEKGKSGETASKDGKSETKGAKEQKKS